MSCEIIYICEEVSPTSYFYVFFVSAMPKRILNAKIACLDFSLQKTKMRLGVQVNILLQ